MDFLEEEFLKEIFVTYRDRHALKLKNRFNLNERNIDGKSPVLRKALYVIERNLFEELSVQHVSDKINASVSTLLRVFKSELSVSPLVHIHERRLEEARSMLKTGQFSILDVAHITGYSSISSFAKAFKRRYKTTPSEFVRTSGEGRRTADS